MEDYFFIVSNKNREKVKGTQKKGITGAVFNL